mgnify:FL=1
MTEQEKKEILDTVRAHLSGNLTADLVMIQETAESYEKKEDGAGVTEELLKLAYEIMPKEQSDYMQKMLYIGEKRLEQVYHDAEELLKNHKLNEATALTEQLYQHIITNFKETPERRFFSFRNLLESNLYYVLYHPTKEMMKAPFDFTRFIGAHAYNLVEQGKAEEAIPVLQEAIRYNPVNPDPRFELAEVYKVLKQHDNLLTAVKETLPICATPYALSRCYTNMGFYCIEIQDYESALCFYYQSLIFADQPAVRGELAIIQQRLNRRLKPPTHEEILKVFEKYQIPFGAGAEVLDVASQLAEQAKAGNRWEEAFFYFGTIYGVTNDPKAKKEMENAGNQIKK